MGITTMAGLAGIGILLGAFSPVAIVGAAAIGVLAGGM